MHKYDLVLVHRRLKTEAHNAQGGRCLFLFTRAGLTHPSSSSLSSISGPGIASVLQSFIMHLEYTAGYGDDVDVEDVDGDADDEDS